MIMKNLFRTFRLFVIAIAMFGFGNRVMAQADANFNIVDGGSVLFNAGTYTGTITSWNNTQSSTARLSTDGVVTLQGTYSGYYGFIRPNAGSSVSLFQSTFASKLEIGNTGYATPAKIWIDKNGGVTLSGSTDANVITMDKYGVLDVRQNLTMTLGKIQLNSYNDANAPYIQFHPTSTTPKITLSEEGMKILTNDATSNRIDASKHLKFDMTEAPKTSVGVNNFILASFSATGDPVVTGTPALTGDADGVWESPTVDVNNNNLRLNATYAPLFQINSLGSDYAANLAGLVDRNTDQFQKLLKTKALDASYTVQNKLLLDLQAFNLTGGQTFSIGSGQTLGIKGSGSFTNVVSFSDANSRFQIIGAFTASQMPSVDASSASGTIVVGDGGIASSLTVDATLITSFNSKVSQIVVETGATVTVTP
jgi:hypothetical protein